jgi:hypothetical protein
MDKIDKIVIDVPTFLRLLELAREEVKEDAELHYIAEIATKISKMHPITMKDYKEIYDGSINKSKENDLERIKQLSGLQ